MTTLEGFEDAAREALLEEAESKMPELVARMQDIAEDNWRSYASANDYDIEHIWRDVESEIDRAGDEITATVEWPFSAQFEHGVDPHVIEASDAEMLAFEWSEMAGVEFGETGRTFDEVFADTWPVVFFPKVNWGSESGGIPKARAVRDMLRELRGEMRG